MTRSSFKRFLVPLHITGLVYVTTLAVVDPTSRLNLALVLFLLLFRQVPALVQLIACTVYYRKASVLFGFLFDTPSSCSSITTDWKPFSASMRGRF